MTREEFKKYIESIGFKSDTDYGIYSYKEYRIYLYNNYYHFYNGSEWVFYINFDNLTDLETIFKQELRSFKLKELLRCV